LLKHFIEHCHWWKIDEKDFQKRDDETEREGKGKGRMVNNSYFYVFFTISSK